MPDLEDVVTVVQLLEPLAEVNQPVRGLGDFGPRLRGGQLVETDPQPVVRDRRRTARALPPTVTPGSSASWNRASDGTSAVSASGAMSTRLRNRPGLRICCSPRYAWTNSISCRSATRSCPSVASVSRSTSLSRASSCTACVEAPERTKSAVVLKRVLEQLRLQLHPHLVELGPRQIRLQTRRAQRLAPEPAPELDGAENADDCRGS